MLPRSGWLVGLDCVGAHSWYHTYMMIHQLLGMTGVGQSAAVSICHFPFPSSLLSID